VGEDGNAMPRSGRKGGKRLDPEFWEMAGLVRRLTVRKLDGLVQV